MTTNDDGESINKKKIGEKTDSCIPYFDALWFCYCTYVCLHAIHVFEEPLHCIALALSLES